VNSIQFFLTLNSHDQLQNLTHNFNISKHDKNYVLAFILIKQSLITTKTNPKTQNNSRSRVFGQLSCTWGLAADLEQGEGLSLLVTVLEKLMVVWVAARVALGGRRERESGWAATVGLLTVAQNRGKQ